VKVGFGIETRGLTDLTGEYRFVIDAHHHFWKYDAIQYSWISEGMTRIRRDFFPADLEREITAVGIEGVVSVQARQSLEETRWLLDLAGQHEFIRGVVGWVPLDASMVSDDLAELATHAKLKAVRHVVQDEPDPEFMDRARFNAGIKSLKAFDLAYDILIYESQLPAAIRLVDRHPDQRFILDHIAKPRIHEGILSPWRENMVDLARRENVTCKISGMVTEADPKSWTSSQLQPYFDAALDAFGPRRLMFGTDWPVCLVACEYGQWHTAVKNFIAPLSAAEQNRIMGETAIEAYRLS
jgi:L-fucono-1,5-lactonase